MFLPGLTRQRDNRVQLNSLQYKIGPDFIQ